MSIIQVEVPDELRDRLKAIIPSEDAINQLALSALEEWVAWLDGSHRPMSISELETHRVFALYSHIIKEELPSADHLGKLLNLPMGRARYIMQSLAYRYGQLIPQRQMMAIARALRDAQWSASHEAFVINVDRACQSIIDRVMSGLMADDQLKSTVRGIATMDGVRYNLGAKHHEVLTAFFSSHLID